MDGSQIKAVLTCTFPVPKIGAGKHKNQLVTNNNVSIWKRWYETKIKKTFKDSLRDWTVPESELKLKSGTVEFQLYRPTRHRLDADSITWEGKWFVDFLVEQGYFEDDDQVTFIYKPVIVEHERVETEVYVVVKG